MTDAPENFARDEDVDRLLARAPAPPAMSADLVARIAAAAAATPQLEPAPRRAFGERRTGLARVRRRVWVGVIAANLVAAAAAAAALNVVHYDVRRIAEIPALILHRPVHTKAAKPMSAVVASPPATLQPSASALQPPKPLNPASTPVTQIGVPNAAPIRPSQDRPPSAIHASEEHAKPPIARRTVSVRDRKLDKARSRSVSAEPKGLASGARMPPAEAGTLDRPSPDHSLGGGDLRKDTPAKAPENLGHDDDKPAAAPANAPIKTDLTDRVTKSDAATENAKADEGKAAEGRQNADEAARPGARFGDGRFGAGRFGGRRFQNGQFQNGQFQNGQFQNGRFGGGRFGGGRFGGQKRFSDQAGGAGLGHAGAAPDRPAGRGRFWRFRRQGPR